MTGRSGMRRVPALKGAFRLNVNDATAPGPTDDSFCTATRFADGQPMFMPRALNDALSPLTPSATWLPATPLVHVFVPVLRKSRVACDVDAGCIAGTWVCDNQAEWRPLSATVDVGPPPLTVAPVLKSHWLVSH